MEDRRIYKRYREPATNIVRITGEQGPLEIDSRAPDFLTQVTRWTDIRADANSFKDTETGEILSWRALRPVHK
jgi:hypothetical protein